MDPSCGTCAQRAMSKKLHSNLQLASSSTPPGHGPGRVCDPACLALARGPHASRRSAHHAVSLSCCPVKPGKAVSLHTWLSTRAVSGR